VTLAILFGILILVGIVAWAVAVYVTPDEPKDPPRDDVAHLEGGKNR
jgi:hypothetical protein